MRAFPHYGYHDIVRATHQLLLNGLHVNHLRLVMGTSMGGMQTWMWGEMYPTMMDALMPLASLPVQISGRNRIWREMIADLITSSPDYDGGNYTNEAVRIERRRGSAVVRRECAALRPKLMPTRGRGGYVLPRNRCTTAERYDANDLLYQISISRDYDPEPQLGSIVAPLLAINSSDDQINPPELGILQREIENVPHGRYIVLADHAGPAVTERTRGLQSGATIWKSF